MNTLNPVDKEHQRFAFNRQAVVLYGGQMMNMLHFLSVYYKQDLWVPGYWYVNMIE